MIQNPVRIHSVVEHEVWGRIRSQVAHQVCDWVHSRTWTQIERLVQDRVDAKSMLVWDSIRDQLEQDVRPK